MAQDNDDFLDRKELLEEIERLHEFTRQLAERLFLAAEVLSILAERKSKNEVGIKR